MVVNFFALAIKLRLGGFETVLGAAEAFGFGRLGG